MKLRLKSEKYIKHCQNVARRSEKRRLRLKKRRNSKSRLFSKMTAEERRLFNIKNPNRVVVTVPSGFSFLDNTNVVTQLIDKLESALIKAKLESKELYVDMWHANHIDYATIAALLAVLYRARKNGININGNWPRRKSARKMFTRSGFLYSLFSDEPDAGHKYTFNADHQLFTLNVHDIKIVGEIRDDVSMFLTGQKKLLGGLFTTLGELMDNAVSHSGEDGRWWLSINYDRTKKKVKFVFIDYGVGILSSLVSKVEAHRVKTLWEKAVSLFGMDAVEEQLKLILQESAGEIYNLEGGHGEGIHGIYSAAQRCELNRLHVISNRASGDVSQDKYTRLSNDFKGTVYYWEVSVENV